MKAWVFIFITILFPPLALSLDLDDATPSKNIEVSLAYYPDIAWIKENCISCLNQTSYDLPQDGGFVGGAFGGGVSGGSSNGKGNILVNNGGNEIMYFNKTPDLIHVSIVGSPSNMRNRDYTCLNIAKAYPYGRRKILVRHDGRIEVVLKCKTLIGVYKKIFGILEEGVSTTPSCN